MSMWGDNMSNNYKDEIIKLVQQINEERFLRYLYILINEMAKTQNSDNSE